MDVVVLSGRVRMQRPRNRFHTYTWVYSCVCVCSLQFARVYLYRYIYTRGHYIRIYGYKMAGVTRFVKKSFRFVNKFFFRRIHYYYIYLCFSCIYRAGYDGHEIKSCTFHVHIYYIYRSLHRRVYYIIIYTRMHANIIWSLIDHIPNNNNDNNNNNEKNCNIFAAEYVTNNIR